jgi:hypothetical protein
MTDLIEQIFGDAQSAETPEAVELVTLTPEQLTHGIINGNPLPFPDLRTALSFARTMMPEEREASWIRTADEVLTLAQAEDRVAKSTR